MKSILNITVTLYILWYRWCFFVDMFLIQRRQTKVLRKNWFVSRKLSTIVQTQQNTSLVTSDEIIRA